MKHFAAAEWTDFVRGLARAESDSMRQHLSVCDPCARLAGLLQRVADVAPGKDAPEVPEYLVRDALLMFSLNKPQKESASRLFARLIYDSFRSPLPVAVRSQRSLSRYALYEAGDYCIDLCLQYQSGRYADWHDRPGG